MLQMLLFYGAKGCLLPTEGKSSKAVSHTLGWWCALLAQLELELMDPVPQMHLVTTCRHNQDLGGGADS